MPVAKYYQIKEIHSLYKSGIPYNLCIIRKLSEKAKNNLKNYLIVEDKFEFIEPLLSEKIPNEEQLEVFKTVLKKYEKEIIGDLWTKYIKDQCLCLKTTTLSFIRECDDPNIKKTLSIFLIYHDLERFIERIFNKNLECSDTNNMFKLMMSYYYDYTFRDLFENYCAKNSLCMRTPDDLQNVVSFID